jgi:hypothetical protein
MKSEGWLLLLYELPARRNSARVSLWRQLKKSGALPLKTSASLLPNTPKHAERFQWLAQEVRDGGGEATLIRVSEVEGLSHDEIARLFNEARAKDYEELIAELTALLARKKAKARESFHGELEKLGRRLEGIHRLDFFNCPRAQDAQMIMQRARNLRTGKGRANVRLSAKRFLGKTWLIRRFIDPKARFIFASDPKQFPKAIPYDMADVDFSHHCDDCTFETLIKRFRISDKAALQIAEMVHEADLEDEKFSRKECVGLDHILKGWARLGLSDEELLKKGSECFDALYEYIRR